ncbi:probable trehalose-phosphate phosphatase C isoform X2 [Teleopsis dalmanni]|uniref:probable trehalose-phosphate phosphatase C isoform X1 n=2 Tax=Teleopsis dalmanni TaxID=139649 RepID=UPI000D32C57B|nr:probable trehalose-phosphate phosphatase C isoform X1 [Teleopsis dalmanni]XP_037959987.1 probable trehalose-phosphate phosphatase C isoform X2 [Teleopsis dalmanni]
MELKKGQGIFLLLFLLVLGKNSIASQLDENHSDLLKQTTEEYKMPEKRLVPAISSLEEFETNLPGYLNPEKKLAILLDYDGTLAPIASNPNKTAMPIECEILLNKIASHPKVFLAVISGRGIKDVQEKVGIANITYAGNHGIEIENPDGTRQDYKLSGEVLNSYRQLVNELNQQVSKNNAWVEDKRVSLTYHYRDTPPLIKEEQKQLAIKIIEAHGFRANQAHEAIEAKPPVNWNKGEAALLILKNKFGNNWSNHAGVVFAGDDNTDEDAMRVLQGLGKTFRISTDPNIETFADFRLARQDLVTDLLKWIASAYHI